MPEIQTAEGVEEADAISLATMREALPIMVERKMTDAIPALVDQVRVSEEQYVLKQDITAGEIASLCTRAAVELLDIKYGPIRGIEYIPPVSNGRWQW